MIKKTKAQGLSIRFIILAVLGIIILTVVIYFFFQESSKNVKTLQSCEIRQGKCVPEKTEEGGRFCPWEKEIRGVDCGTGRVCCSKFG